MTIGGLRFQVVDGHTNGALEDLEVPRPPHERPARHAVPSRKVLAPSGASTGVRLGGRSRRRQNGVIVDEAQVGRQPADGALPLLLLAAEERGKGLAHRARVLRAAGLEARVFGVEVGVGIAGIGVGIGDVEAAAEGWGQRRGCVQGGVVNATDEVTGGVVVGLGPTATGPGSHCH